MLAAPIVYSQTTAPPSTELQACLLNEVDGSLAQIIQPLGCHTQEVINPILEFIRQDAVAPGLAAIILATGFVCTVIIFYIGWRDSVMLVKAKQAFPRGSDTLSDEQAFASGYPDFEQKMVELQPVYRAWSEFTETLVTPKSNDTHPVYKNTVRPHVFFNLDRLHIGLASKKQWPNLAVGIGLFLTFLGLISALGEALTAINVSDVGDQKIQESLSGLLGATSAKFYASMSALFVSLVLTISINHNESKIKRALEHLNDRIESGVQFITQEELSQKSIRILEQQLEQLQTFNTTLAIDIGNAVKNSLEQAFQPIVDNINGLTAGVGEGTTQALTQAADEMVKKIQGATLDSLTNIAQTLTNLDGSLSSLTVELSSTLEGFKTGFDSILTNLKSEVTGTTSTITSDISEVLKMLEGSLTQSTTSINNVMQEVASTLQEFKQISSDSTARISDEFANTTAETSERLNQVLGEVADTMERFSATSEETSNMASENFVTSVGDAADADSGALTNAGASIAGAVESAAGRAIEAAEESGNAASAVITGAGDRFEDQLNEILIRVGDMTAETARDAGAQIQQAGSAIAGGFEESTTKLITALDAASIQFVQLETKLHSLPPKLENIKTGLDASSKVILESNKGLETTNKTLSNNLETFVSGISSLQSTMSQASNTFLGAGTSITTAAERITTTTETLASQLDRQVQKADQTDANLAKYLGEVNRTTNQVVENLGMFATELDNNIGSAIGQLNSVVDELVDSVETLQERLASRDQE